MKKRKVNKLSLNKATVVRLDQEEMTNLKGGGSAIPCYFWITQKLSIYNCIDDAQ